MPVMTQKEQKLSTTWNILQTVWEKLGCPPLTPNGTWRKVLDCSNRICYGMMLQMCNLSVSKYNASKMWECQSDALKRNVSQYKPIASLLSFHQGKRIFVAR